MQQSRLDEVGEDGAVHRSRTPDDVRQPLGVRGSRVGAQRGVGLADPPARLRIGPTGDPNDAVVAVQQDDVTFIEDRDPVSAIDIRELEQATAGTGEKTDRVRPDDRDRRLSELACERVDVREKRTPQAERPRRSEDPADVVGGRPLGDQDRPLGRGHLDVGAVTAQRAARHPR